MQSVLQLCFSRKKSIPAIGWIIRTCEGKTCQLDHWIDELNLNLLSFIVAGQLFILDPLCELTSKNVLGGSQKCDPRPEGLNRSVRTCFTNYGKIKKRISLLYFVWYFDLTLMKYPKVYDRLGSSWKSFQYSGTF